ncbi:MAG: oxidoreductase, partial [Rubrivivax sp.]|nr:oxidoreductase [Rubrivivax sp.]
QMQKSARPWAGERGKVDEDLLKRAVGDLSAPTYLITGPPAMVEAMQATLQFAGVEPGRIVTEEFYGY